MEPKYLFGGDSPWTDTPFVASDDRVRGGASKSTLVVTPSSAIFTGTLSKNPDLVSPSPEPADPADPAPETGAGFASQHTLSKSLNLNLSAYSGLLITLFSSDGKKYTLLLKDSLPGMRPDGREESSVNWQVDFGEEAFDLPEKGDGGEREVYLPWDAFKSIYRGRPVTDGKKLDTKGIKRVGFMIRSFFGQQEGDFKLGIRSVAAVAR